MMIFTNSTAREQYVISGHEVNPPHGPMVAYEQATGQLYRPKSAGRGPDKWELLGHAPGRAYGGIRSVKLQERVADQSREDILIGDERIVVDDIIVDGEIFQRGLINQRGEVESSQLTFKQESGGRYVGHDDEETLKGDLTLDGELTLDGTLTCMFDIDSEALPLVRNTITTSMAPTVDFDFVMCAEGQVPIVDGEIILNGEIV